MSDIPPRSFQITPPKGSTAKEEPKPRRRADTAPKTPTARGRAEAADVEKAMAILGTLYELTSSGMELFGLVETRAKWQEATAKLQRTNADSLSASPKLAKSIAAVGEQGGAGAFFLSHAFAVAVIVPTARREMTERLEEAQAGRHAAPASSESFDFEQAARTVFEQDQGAPFPGGYDPSVFIPGVR
jgi:hypothetical protein